MLRSHRMHVAALAAIATALVAVGCGGGDDELQPPPHSHRPSGTNAGPTGATRYFPSSVFRDRLADNAPIDPDSQHMVQELTNMAFGVDPANQFDCRNAVMAQQSSWSPEELANCVPLTTRAGIAFDDFAPKLYTVGADQARVPVVSDNGDTELQRAFAEGVPIPDDAQAAEGSDAQLIIWQPAKDTMWELWRAYKDASGTWHAGYGGRMVDVSDNPGHFEDVPDPDRPGGVLERHSWGGPSSSIPNLPGLMTIDQLRSGEIGHALVFATWANAPGQWVYPAQRTDGACRGQYCSDIPQGARFRLDPDYDVSRIHNPIVRMIATAAQDYGIILNNTTAGGVSFYAQGWQGQYPEDPYHGPHGLFDSDPLQLQPTLFMREFPWERLELLERGRTCTDPTVECAAPDLSR